MKTMKGQTIAFFDNFHFGHHTTLKKKQTKNTVHFAKIVGSHFEQAVTQANQYAHSNFLTYMLDEHSSKAFLVMWLSKKGGKGLETLQGQTIAFFVHYICFC